MAKHVLVIEDQIVPANSPEVSEAQQQMWSFARENGTEYVYGQAMASHYLVDNVLQGQELVLSADKDIMMIGAVGALGIYVEPEELAEYLISGNIELDLRVITRYYTLRDDKYFASGDDIDSVIGYVVKVRRG